MKRIRSRWIYLLFVVFLCVANLFSPKNFSGEKKKEVINKERDVKLLNYDNHEEEDNSWILACEDGSYDAGVHIDDKHNELKEKNKPKEIKIEDKGFLKEPLQYKNKPYEEVNNNEPYFDKDISPTTYEDYSELDSLGRTQVADAVLGLETMPNEKRGKIGMIKPSGWQTKRYDDLIKDKYLFNRCHLIAFMLSGGNANPKNLITGTRSLNIDGMLPFEKQVQEYILKTKNHVRYRVTPIYKNDELVARGVLMEAYSIEDKGKGIKYNVYVFNNQKGIDIDYKTGNSKRQ